MLQQYLRPADFSPVPEIKDVAIGLGATAVAKSIGKEEYSVTRAMRAPRRYTQARNAIAIAATMAASDGPLPVGDVIAIGFLTTFAVYQGYQGIRDVIQ